MTAILRLDYPSMTIHRVQLYTLGLDGIFRFMQQNRLYFLDESRIKQLIESKQSGTLPKLDVAFGMYDWHAETERTLRCVPPQGYYYIEYNWRQWKKSCRTVHYVQASWKSILAYMKLCRAFPARAEDADKLEQAKSHEEISVQLVGFYAEDIAPCPKNTTNLKSTVESRYP